MRRAFQLLRNALRVIRNTFRIIRNGFRLTWRALRADGNALPATGKAAGVRAARPARVPATQSKHFAPDHPNMAISYNNLAHICIGERNIPAAVALWRRSYPIRLKALGPDHPYTKGDAAMLRKYDPPGP